MTDERRLTRIVDDVLTGRDLHGLSPTVARDLQLAAAAITHERFRRLLGSLAALLHPTNVDADAGHE